MAGSPEIDLYSFDPLTEILTDFEGNRYTTKVYGSKRWMTQDLRSMLDSEGGCIDAQNGLRFNPAKASTLMTAAQITARTSIPAGNVSFKQNGVQKTMTNDDFVSAYGLVYTWEQANRACPKGWHLATTQDWKDLGTTLGVANLGAKLRGNTGMTYTASDSGSTYTWGMSDPTVTSAGFNAIPAGWVREDGLNAVGFSSTVYWWTGTSRTYKYLGYSSTGISDFSTGNVLFHFSVRCVQD